MIVGGVVKRRLKINDVDWRLRSHYFLFTPSICWMFFVLGEREEKRRIEKGGKKEGNETIEERERIPYPCLAIN
jgi:hypothetical protein